MAKVQSTTAEAIAPWLDDVQHVSVESIETRTTIEWPSSLGINIEATALNASTYRGDQVVIERLAKFSANGSLAARFMFAGEPSIDALPTPSDWMAQSGITLRGGAHTAIAFAQSGGASFIRSGPRLLQIGYDTYGSSFPVSVEFPGGTRITEGGALGIGVGVPASALHVSSAGDQVRIEYPGGGFLGIEVGPYGNAQFSTTGGQSTFAGVLKTDTLNAGDVNVTHLHTSTQVLDSTLALSGFVGFSSVSGYVMADVVGGAWTEGSVIFTTTYDRDVSFVVAERVAEPGTQLFQVGQTVTFAWLVRDGGVETIQTLSVVIAAYDGRDPTVYPAQQTYTFHQHEESVFGSPPPPDPLGGGDVLVPKRAIASYGGLGALSMINGRPLLTMSGPTIGQWHDNYRGIKSENGHMLMSMGWIGAEGDDVEFIRVTDNYGDVTNFELTSSVGLTKGAKLTLKGGTLPSPTTRLAFDGGENTLAINASSLQVDGTAVTLSSVVPNTAPSAGQILVGNAGGTAYAPVSVSGDATLASTGALTIGTLPGVTIAGSITITAASGRRILGDFGNTTPADRPFVQSNTGTYTAFGVMPPSGGAQSYLQVYNATDIANAAYLSIAATATETRVVSNKSGAGTLLPFQLRMAATTRLTVDTTGDIQLTPATNAQLTGLLKIVGAADATQLTIKAHSAQAVNKPLLAFEANGSATELLRLSVYGTQNVWLGYLAGGNSISGGGYNVGIGYEALTASTNGAYNVGVGVSALQAVTSGGYNVGVGANTFRSVTTASENVGIGDNAGYHATGAYNVAIGRNAYYGASTLTTGSQNMLIGSHAGYAIQGASGVVGIGVNALRGHTSGSYTIGIGYGASYYTTSAAGAVAIGGFAAGSAASADYQIAIGYNTAANATGAGNVAIGAFALDGITTGTANTVIGYAAFSAAAGSRNTALGYLSGYTSTGSGNVFLGYMAGYSETGSNLLYIANSNTATPLIHGNFSTAVLTINGDLTLADAKNIVVNATTGTKIGTSASQKLGLWNATPVVQPASANQAAVSATAATQTTPWGFTSQAQADGIVTLLNELRSALVSIGAIKGAA